MIEFQVKEMRCGGCERAIRAALQAVVPQATVEADVPARRVWIDAPDAERPRIAAALAAAGYDAMPLVPAAEWLAPAAAGRASRGGCGCAGGGCCGTSRAAPGVRATAG